MNYYPKKAAGLLQEHKDPATHHLEHSSTGISIKLCLCWYFWYLYFCVLLNSLKVQKHNGPTHFPPIGTALTFASICNCVFILYIFVFSSFFSILTWSTATQEFVSTIPNTRSHQHMYLEWKRIWFVGCQQNLYKYRYLVFQESAGESYSDSEVIVHQLWFQKKKILFDVVWYWWSWKS